MPQTRNHLRTFINYFVNAGITPDTDPYRKRTTRFVNLFSIITIIGLLIGLTNIAFLGGNYPFLVESILFICSFATILLNKKHLYNVAIYGYLVSVNCAIFYVNEYYDITSAAYIFYFPLILCVALLHNPVAGLGQTVSYFIISAGFISASLFFEYPSLKNNAIPVSDNHLLFIFNLSFGVVLSMLLVIMFINLINKQNSELIESLGKEKTNQEKLSASLHEKEILLQEIHHRVKNNLTVISSLLNLQINNATQSESRQLLSDARNRVLSMSLVHQKLYKGRNFNKIQFDNYLVELTRDLLYASPLKDVIQLKESLEPCEMDISRAIPLGLIVNEIVTNSVKHAFKNYSGSAQITIELKKNRDFYLRISDNGPGFDFETNKSSTASLGLTLIESLAEQIDGKITCTAKNGSHYELVFPS
ncbi:MAG TPA: sensor histidine kinase [Flavobacteriales bacterium]|nr:sensor histidine kinase [Flavobacteriales bacterium]